ncbi:MAG: LacI family DNA-binding transcriptional regulator [Spirochaetaceae bacterium]|nr:LacI family DNA-binding transcriptional regulator [Spirochaetaceae bacterium]
MLKPINTMKEVAKRAGVSVSTVSRVLANKDYIKANTRKKVEEAAKELNYRPNVMAKGLKLGRSNAIAIMIPSIDNLIFPEIVRGVEDVARSKNYVVTLCNTDEDVDKEKVYMKKLSNMGVDGMVVATMRADSHHITELYIDNFPVVLTSRHFDNTIDAIIIDNYRAAYDAVKYLISRGYKNIAIALGNKELPLYANRYAGYKDALLEANLTFNQEYVMEEINNTDSFYPLCTNLLKKHREIDCIFATNDIRAITCMRAIKDLGLNIPSDIGVMGFDDIKISALVEPPLTTTNQKLYEIGAKAARRLIEQIIYQKENGELLSPEIKILDTNLIIRKSTK